jgi:hypothetical protein
MTGTYFKGREICLFTRMACVRGQACRCRNLQSFISHSHISFKHYPSRYYQSKLAVWIQRKGMILQWLWIKNMLVSRPFQFLQYAFFIHPFLSRIVRQSQYTVPPPSQSQHKLYSTVSCPEYFFTFLRLPRPQDI